MRRSGWSRWRDARTHGTVGRDARLPALPPRSRNRQETRGSVTRCPDSVTSVSDADSATTHSGPVLTVPVLRGSHAPSPPTPRFPRVGWVGELPDRVMDQPRPLRSRLGSHDKTNGDRHCLDLSLSTPTERTESRLGSQRRSCIPPFALKCSARAHTPPSLRTPGQLGTARKARRCTHVRGHKGPCSRTATSSSHSGSYPATQQRGVVREWELGPFRCVGVHGAGGQPELADHTRHQIDQLRPLAAHESRHRTEIRGQQPRGCPCSLPAGMQTQSASFGDGQSPTTEQFWMYAFKTAVAGQPSRMATSR